MQDTSPITIADILAAVDGGARYPVPEVYSFTVRALTLRELLRCMQRHPQLVEILDPSQDHSAVELFDVLGRRAVADVVVVATGRTRFRIRRMSAVALLHAFLAAVDATLGTRDLDDLFTERRPVDDDEDQPTPTADGSAMPTSTDIKAASNLMAIVRAAGIVSARLGIDGFDLSPRRLAFILRTFADIDRKDRQLMSAAISAALGSEEADKLIGGLY